MYVPKWHFELYTDSDVSVLTRGENGKTQYEPMPRYISLGHELIHTLRLMGGNEKPLDTYHKGSYLYTEPNDSIEAQTYFVEELETTGISYTMNSGAVVNAWSWYTTENALRTEHYLNRRIRY